LPERRVGADVIVVIYAPQDTAGNGTREFGLK
jgi:hypothetical protein